ncbi:MAG: histidine kinase [Lachnospiraceae bacterium]|nr:histidine kinase [Lachnospiraceae bacterium]
MIKSEEKPHNKNILDTDEHSAVVPVKKGIAAWPIRVKLLAVMMASITLLLAANIVMYINVNRIARHLDEIYSGNVQLNELEKALDELQGAFTVYMNTRSTDTLQNYYEKEQLFSQYSDALSGDLTDNTLLVMERNIKNLSESYLQLTGRTIDARRGRNVEKYSAYYEEAGRVYEYLSANISGLNKQRFTINTESYETLSKSLSYMEKSGAVVFMLVALLDTLMVLMMTRSMTDPLLELSLMANKVSEGKLDEAGTVPVRAMDEIGIVTVAFNQMVSSIPGYLERLRQSMEKEQALMERELLMEAHLKDARLKYLQSQVDPHFLFNTLNAGSQLAFLEGAKRTQNYVQKVADFFRYTISLKKEDVSLEEEIRMVDTYIYILNVRFSGDIHFEKNIEDLKLLRLMVPYMILQPIVENSIKYGIRDMGDKGKIELSVFEVDDDVCICIADNGEGMSAELIDRILSGSYGMGDPSDTGDKEHVTLDTEGQDFGTSDDPEDIKMQTGDASRDRGSGVGLNNVMQRLALYFDHKNRFEIISQGAGQGCEVVITIPAGDLLDDGEVGS